MTVLAPVTFDAPLLNPAPTGLYAATTWQLDAVPRWLDGGVQFRPANYGGGDAFGVWTADWLATHTDLTPSDVKGGGRPDLPDVFAAMTVWAYDESSFPNEDQAAARDRALQILRIEEQAAVEAEFADRLLADSTPDAVADLVAAVAELEAALAKTNTVGYIHAGAHLAAVAAQSMLIVRTGTALRTPLGHQWVFGGGYVDALEDTIVATSQPFGWRTDPIVRDAIKPQHNRFAAVAERSLVIGYEAAVGAATIT